MVDGGEIGKAKSERLTQRAQRAQSSQRRGDKRKEKRNTEVTEGPQR
jgi:hypothetical protein